MMEILQLKGKEKRLYRLLAPIIMDPMVIRANNNYPFKTGDNFLWFVALEGKNVLGFVPVELKTNKKALLNNYYIKGENERRNEIVSFLLAIIIETLIIDNWRLSTVTLIQDKEIFEKHQFTTMEKGWTRYVKMNR